VKYTEYSIAWADFPYDDISFSEIRPVLILGIKSQKDKTLCAKITSTPPRNNYNDLRISNSLQIGLQQESTIRLDTLVYINDNDIKDRIARLSTHDIKEVKHALIEMIKKKNQYK
jgi:mRNA-degrading endonuclease toxin of MazEF toxin-antitoxin module